MGNDSTEEPVYPERTAAAAEPLLIKLRFKTPTFKANSDRRQNILK